MKIAQVSPYDFTYPGGVTAHITSLTREFVSRGHTVKVLAPCSSRPPEMDGVDVLPFGRPVPIPAAGSVARLSVSVWLEPKLRAILRDQSFDVVHIHEPFMPMLPLGVANYSSSLLVGTFHAFNESQRWYRAAKYIGNYLVDRAHNRLHGRIAVSEAARTYVSRMFPADYAIIPNGIDVDRFSEPSPPLPEFSDGRLTVLFLGRIGEKRKGLKYLLAAYSELKWDYPDLRLVVVGPGVPDPDSYRIMAERNINDVVFTGPVSQADLPRYYQAADIFCSPATGRESFGMVLLEAMACSTPIVASNIRGYASVVTHGEQGLLVTPRSERALAAGLRTLIEDAELRRRLSGAGRRTVEAYRWDRVAEQVLAHYGAVGARRQPAAYA